ncbi:MULTISPECIES: hypothetical protein [Micrococcaceae]|uniref:hypothetical protein n=1 Tax=Micrococcaceae TaxID=1268 RepID=UPI0006F56FC5|nr:hypothetical protein [Arthrobacter sp. Soil761]KRE75136.1 hypothetical protein ASG79_20020 [Arthrobacter sp. Soil761]
MLRKVGFAGPRAPVGAAVFALPCCVLVLLELHPGTTVLEHLSEAFALIGGGLLLMVRRPTGREHRRALPREHTEAFRYALRTGTLPLASLFSDWSGELAHHRFLLRTALRCVPALTWTALIMDLYGMLMYAEVLAFFLISALAAAVSGMAAFSRGTIALGNIHVLENRLRLQQQLLGIPLA